MSHPTQVLQPKSTELILAPKSVLPLLAVARQHEDSWFSAITLAQCNDTI